MQKIVVGKIIYFLVVNAAFSHLLHIYMRIQFVHLSFKSFLSILLKPKYYISGQENKVRVDTSQAGEGALSVNIRAAGQEVRHSIQVKLLK